MTPLFIIKIYFYAKYDFIISSQCLFIRTIWLQFYTPIYSRTINLITFLNTWQTLFTKRRPFFHSSKIMWPNMTPYFHFSHSNVCQTDPSLWSFVTIPTHIAPFTTTIICQQPNNGVRLTVIIYLGWKTDVCTSNIILLDTKNWCLFESLCFAWCESMITGWERIFILMPKTDFILGAIFFLYSKIWHLFLIPFFSKFLK